MGSLFEELEAREVAARVRVEELEAEPRVKACRRAGVQARQIDCADQRESASAFPEQGVRSSAKLRVRQGR